jgi:hypothetical protein
LGISPKSGGVGEGTFLLRGRRQGRDLQLAFGPNVKSRNALLELAGDSGYSDEIAAVLWRLLPLVVCGPQMSAIAAPRWVVVHAH